MKVAQLLIAAIASLTASLCLFAFVVHKPLTIGVMQDYFDLKLGYLAGIEGNKIVILSGSNGRFSHRCETVEELTGIPCTNMAIAAGISIEYQARKIMPYLRPGDLVYIPLEYHEYRKPKEEVLAGIEVPLAVAYDREYALAMGFDRLKNALYYFDLKFLISGLGEMAMKRMGIEARFSADTMTKQGDEKGHTLDKAKPYRDYLDNVAWGGKAGYRIAYSNFKPDSYGVALLTEFLEWASANDVLVVGGLPTVFDDVEISAELLQKLCEFYVGNGHEFLALESRSQYDPGLFYDAAYHLAEPGQIEHTRRLAPKLAAIMQGAEHTPFCVSH